MGMLLSNLLPIITDDSGDVQISHEREFERFSRITSIRDQTVCVYIGDEAYLKKLCEKVKMIITTPEIAEKIDKTQYGLCITPSPKRLYFRALNYVNCHTSGSSKATLIGSNCKISKLSCIYPENIVIGDNVIVEEFAVIYPNTVIGDNCIIRAGAKIGIQDYNYYSEKNGLEHIEHAGDVLVGKNVEVGYNTVVGRGLYYGDSTIIGDNSKISHNCCIGHDVRLGLNTMIYSGSVIGGYTMIEDGAHVTMNSTVKNGIRIGKNAMVCMGSNVILNVRDNVKVFGNPATKVKL